MMQLNRRNLLKSMVTGAALVPALGARALAQGGAASPIPAVTSAAGSGPAGVLAFVTAAKAAIRAGPQAWNDLVRGADSDFNPAASTEERAWSEASPAVMIRENVNMVTPEVAMVDAEVGRFQTVNGWQSAAQLWMTLERRGQGANETWKPVLVRAYAAERDFTTLPSGIPPITILPALR